MRSSIPSAWPRRALPDGLDLSWTNWARNVGTVSIEASTPGREGRRSSSRAGLCRILVSSLTGVST
eukprot:1946188-Pyramimonas_sp.AAC.1